MAVGLSTTDTRDRHIQDFVLCTEAGWAGEEGRVVSGEEARNEEKHQVSWGAPVSLFLLEAAE